MIGGHDVSLTGPVLRDDMEVLLRAARAAWPSAVLESGDGETQMPIGEAIRHQTAMPSEVFLYKNRGAYESWTASGLTEENAEEMVAITAETDCLSFVLNDPAASTGSIVTEMIEAVRENRRTRRALPCPPQHRWPALAEPAT